MIYAKVDVKLRDHNRAQRAGEAMSTWLWGLLYTREQELDGFIPESAMRGAWVPEKVALRHAATLCSVGLWEPAAGGWKVSRYGDKNETKVEVAARKAEAKERMARVRANKQRTNANVRDTERSGSGSEISRSRLDGPRPFLAVVPPLRPAPFHGPNREAEADRRQWAAETAAATPEERTAAAKAAMEKLKFL